MDTISMLRKAETLETQIGLLYEWLSTVLVESPEVSGALFRLSMEEQAHARLVAYQRRTLTHNFHPKRDTDLLEKLCEEIDGLLRDISEFRETNQRPTLAEAVEMAIFLETTAAEKVHRDAVAAVFPELGSLVRQLGGDDRRHLKNLQDLAFGQSRLANEANPLTRQFPVAAVSDHILRA